MGKTDAKHPAVPSTYILIMANNLDKKGKPRTPSETLEAVVALFRAKYGEPVQILTHRDFAGVMEGIKSFAVKTLPLHHFLVKMDGTA